MPTQPLDWKHAILTIFTTIHNINITTIVDGQYAHRDELEGVGMQQACGGGGQHLLEGIRRGGQPQDKRHGKLSMHLSQNANKDVDT